MNRILITLGLPGAAALLGALSLSLWLGRDMDSVSEPMRVPLVQVPMIVPAKPAATAVPPAAPVKPAEPAKPAGSVLEASSSASAWPCFRGKDSDNVNKDTVRLSRDWEKNPPRLIWSVDDLGEGYAAPAVADGRVFILDYDQVARKDRLRCLNLEDGAPLWSHDYPVEVKRYHGMSRTVPAVQDGFVVTIGPHCHVRCLDAATGRLFWALDLVKDHGTVVPEWYAGQCPLIENGRAVLAPGGPEALLMAVECADGRVSWRTPNPKGWRMSHASVLGHVFKGRRMYVYASRGGVSAVDAGSGALLWEYTDWPKIIADIPTAVALSEDRLFIARAYEQGSLILRLREEGAEIRVELEKKLPRRIFGSDQQTPVFHQGRLYGVRPPRGELVCLDAEGAQLWASGPKLRFGYGPYLVADGLILVMDDNGTMTMVEASAEGYKELGRKKLLEGRETWGPIALVAGRMLVRDLRSERPNSSRLACYDIAER